MSKKILIISDATLEGGTNTYIFDLLNVAKKFSDHDVVLLLDKNENMDVMIHKCRDLGIPVYTDHIYHGNTAEEIIEKKIRDYIDLIKPDCVHVFCASIRSCIKVREVVLEHNIPLFTTETYLPKVYPITDHEIDRVREIYNQIKCGTTVCRSSIGVLKEVYQINTQNVISIPTSIDVKKRAFRERVIQGKIKAVIVARLVKQKGIDIFIEAFHQLDNSIKEKYSIDIIGDGEDYSELQALVSKYQLTEYIHFLGWDQDFIQKLMEYELCIVPSRDEGGLPYVILELLSNGLPCIASDVSGISEVVDYGKYAELFELESVNDLREKLNEVAINPHKLMNKVRGIKEFLVTNYDKETNYQHFLELWANV